MTPEAYQQLITELTRLTRRALPLFGIDQDVQIKLLSYSENAIFGITDAAGVPTAVVRVHRPAYHSPNAIRSELDWMAALRQAGIGTPRAWLGLDGDPLQTLATPTLGERTVTMFSWVAGHFAREDELEASMLRLGELSARMHRHARTWQRPPYFERPRWDQHGTIGPQAHWGHWVLSPGLDAAQTATLRHTAELLCARLDAFGTDPQRFGMIHADPRLANLLIEGDTTHIIDFDDCGIGWFLHDLGAALSFIEHIPACERLVMRWAEGYSRAGSLSEAEVAEFPTFVMQRRLQLLAWRGSHYETELAQSLDAEWVSATARMGAEYLCRMS